MGMYENPPYYLSAYALAVKRGFRGTEDEWLKSLQGPEGKPGGDAYQVAVSQGFEGTEAQWLESLRGPEGPQGKPLYVSLDVDVKTGGWSSDRTYDEILNKHKAQQEIICILALNDGEDLELRLIQATPAALIFGAVVDGVEWQAVISRGSEGEVVVAVSYDSVSTAVRYDCAQELTDEQKTQARENIGAVDESGTKEIITNELAGSYKVIKDVLVDNTLAFTTPWSDSTSSIVSAIDDVVVFTPIATGNAGVKVNLSNVDFTKPLKITATGAVDTSVFPTLNINVFIYKQGVIQQALAGHVTNMTATYTIDLSKYAPGITQIAFTVVAAEETDIGVHATLSAVRVWQEAEKFVVDTGIDEESIADLIDKASDPYHVAPNGDRYIAQVSANGNLVMTPVVPSKALFIGNSLLIGFGFGMAASDSQHDYYYLINQAIAAEKSNYTASKMSGVTWEGATTTEAQETFLNNTLLPKLSEDLELVIVQLGDNVNSEEKLALFADGSRQLLEFIRTNCPKARAAWVGAWYQTAAKQEQMEAACKNTGSTFIDIWDLATTENKSAIGNTYTDESGNVHTITSAGVASHPGDAGFKAIANRVLYKLGIVDTENYYE